MTTLLLPLSSARSLLPPAVIFGVTPHYYVCCSLLRLLKCILPHDTYERIDHAMYHSYQTLVTFFFEKYSGSKVFFYGDKYPTEVKENILYISNHQSATDWALADFLAIRQNSIGQVRYVMKEILKYLPFFGPYFVQHGCIFVKRDGSITEEQLRKRWKVFLKERIHGYWIVIFPEGTRYTAKKKKIIEKSNQIAIREGYEPFENVLFPRSKAIEISLEELTNLDAVYDLTLAFNIPWLPLKSKQEGPSLLEFVSVFGREIHIHFKRIPVSTIPKNSKDRKRWLYDTFKEKDRLLNYFYDQESGRRFPGEQYEIPLQSHQYVPHVMFYSGLLALTLLTERGRSWYFKSWKFGIESLVICSIYYKVMDVFK